jgi:hypothetical protein
MCQTLVLGIVLLACASLAQAQATRTWVSGVGDDANPCSRTAPCKTYAGAISKTARDGEISTLDPGGFGAVTITKSITINGGGGGQGYGSILAALTNGIIVNITDAADTRKTVRLNWLDINGASSGLNGIRWLAGSNLYIENTNIDGFTGNGVDVAQGASGAAKLYLRNVSIRNCVADGVKINSAGTVVIASFDNVSSSGCGNGVNMAAHSRLTARNCTFATNTTAGINHTAADSESTLFHCSVSNNPTGVAATNGISRISDNLIYGNSNGITGNVKSWGNNYIDGNTNNGTPVAPNLTQT